MCSTTDMEPDFRLQTLFGDSCSSVSYQASEELNEIWTKCLG